MKGQNMINTIDKTDTMNLHEIPLGKQSFIATIEKVSEELEPGYHGNDIIVPYIYLKDIKILIGTTWFNVECSGNSVKSKIGNKLERLNLEEEGIISFDAQVEEKQMFFSYEEGETVEDDDIDYEYTVNPVFLPRSYRGKIIVEIYETAFTQNYRLWKDNYVLLYDREEYDRMKNSLDVEHKATKRRDGFYREAQGTYFYGRHIKNFSNIKKH